MKKQIKKTMLWAAAFLALASVSGGAVTLANADESKTISDVTLTMAQGASVRYMPSAEDATKGNGLRFGMTISSADVTWLDENYTVEYGMLIAPKGYTLSEANVFGESAIYDWATFDEENEVWNYTASDKTRIINITGDSGDLTSTSTDTMLFTGSIIDVKAANLTKEFQGVGYVAYTSGEETNYLFATANDNVRSMTYTAQLFLEDDTAEDTEKTAVKGLYVDAVADQDTSVTVNTYQQASDGTYPTTPTTNTLTKKIGSTLTLADVTESGKTVDADKTTFASTPVYANGKTVVNVYYEDSLAKGLASASTNWASEKYMSCWSAVGHVAEGEYFSYSDGIQVHSDKYVEDNDDETVFASATFSKDVIAAAIAKGYTHATVVVENVSVPWIALFNGESTAQVDAQKYPDNATSLTFKVALASFTDGLRVKAVGIWGGHTIKVTSLTLFNAVQEAIETGFASEGTNWATESYKGCWSSDLYGNGGIKSDATKKTTLSKDIVAAAIEKGYKKATIVVERVDVSWGTLYNGNGTTELAAHDFTDNGSPATFKIDLANFTDGITVTFAGEWGGQYCIIVTSLTFSN